MKNKYILLTLCIFGCFLGITSFAYMQSNSTGKLKLTVDSSKKIYKLGEVINLSFNLKNEGSETVFLLDIFGTGSGYLNIDISQNGEDYKRFQHPRWGKLDSCCSKITLEPNKSSEASGKISWIWVKQNVPGYTFSNPGIYYLKASYTTMIDGKKDRLFLESEPIQITIEEPTGEDLEVWNKIKDNGDFAYFIQEGSYRIPNYKPEERAKFQQEIENIINQYPNSFYAQSLQQSLDKFKAREEKRKADKEKMVKPQ